MPTVLTLNFINVIITSCTFYRFVQSGQLEFVTGGWVMTDEANTHYFNMLTQLTEGHLWLYENLGVIPKYDYLK